jgi:hypothetical protein
MKTGAASSSKMLKNNESQNTKILSHIFSCPVFEAFSFFYSQEILMLLQGKVP